jgi:Domain of unknown function (DUF3291)
MEGFRSQLERINAIADDSPGFVWRLQTAEGDATAIRAFEDDRILFNMSVWDSIEALHGYVYQSGHVGPLRNRREWFESLEGPCWFSGGYEPDTFLLSRRPRRSFSSSKSAARRRTHLHFGDFFPAPGRQAGPAPEMDAQFCRSAV